MTNSTNRFWNILWFHVLLLLIFAGPRLAILSMEKVTHGSLNADQDSHYWTAAEELMETGEFEEPSYLEPLYPWFIAAVRLVFGDSVLPVLLFQILIGGVGAVYFYYLCLPLVRHRWIAILALLILSFYPYYLRLTVKIIEVPILRTLLIMMVFHFMRAYQSYKHAIVAGILAGFTLMFRSMVLPGILLIFFSLLLRKSYRQAVLAAILTVGVASPMFINNLKEGAFLFPTRGGINFYLANNELYSRIYPLYHVDLFESYAIDMLEKEAGPKDNLSASEIDAFFYKKSWDFIRQYPARVLKMKIKNFFLFFDPWIVPRHPLGRYPVWVDEDKNVVIGPRREEEFPLRSLVPELLHAFSRTVLLILGFMGIWKRRKSIFREDFVLLAFLINFWFVYSLFWPSTRLYAPIMFILMLYAVYAITPWLERRFPNGPPIFALFRKD